MGIIPILRSCIQLLRLDSLSLTLLLSGLDVDDLEVFNVVDWVGTEGEACAVGLLDL